MGFAPVLTPTWNKAPEKKNISLSFSSATGAQACSYGILCWSLTRIKIEGLSEEKRNFFIIIIKGTFRIYPSSIRRIGLGDI